MQELQPLPLVYSLLLNALTQLAPGTDTSSIVDLFGKGIARRMSLYPLLPQQPPFFRPLLGMLAQIQVEVA